MGGNAAVMDSGYTNFRGYASVTQGTNNVPIVATNLNGYPTTNTFQVVIPPTSGSYTYDLNGNLTNDGTRTFEWDAKNEMTAINYIAGPNNGNRTEFTYNGAGGRVKIVEKTGGVNGTITSTKQYVFGEERDASNTVLKRFFAQGEQRIVSGVTTNYFYTKDHLGSIREMIDSSGTIQARYSYDPYGRRTKISGSLDCDFGFTGHYYHATSGLCLALFRAYDPNLGRWINRDPSGEGSGLNLYAYCADNPINLIDQSGLCADGGGLGSGMLVDAANALMAAAASGAINADGLILTMDTQIIDPKSQSKSALNLVKKALNELDNLLNPQTVPQKDVNNALQKILNTYAPYVQPYVTPNTPENKTTTTTLQTIVSIINKIINPTEQK